MKMHSIIAISAAVLLGTLLPEPASAQLGTGPLAEIVKKKLDKSGEAVSAAGAGEPGASAREIVPKPGSIQASASPRFEPVATTELNVTIGNEVLASLSAGLATELSARDRPARRERCLANLENTSEMMLLLAPDPRLPVFMKNPSVVEAKKTEIELKRCGPAIASLTEAEYQRIGATGRGFTPEQYVALKLRVSTFCQALEGGLESPAASSLVYRDDEKSALRSRCHILLPHLKKVL